MVYTYNFMFYRLNNCHFLTHFMHAHAFFFFVANAVMLSCSSLSLVDVLIREQPFNLKGGLWFFSKKIF